MNKNDLQDYIDKGAIKYSEETYECQLIGHIASFKSGASFVSGILMPEIERFKQPHICDDCDTVQDRLQKQIQSLKNEIEYLNYNIDTLYDEKNLSAKTYNDNQDVIQSLKDENVKIKLENQRYKSELADAKYLLEEDAFENCDEVISNIRKALTQKAEDL